MSTDEADFFITTFQQTIELLISDHTLYEQFHILNKFLTTIRHNPIENGIIQKLCEVMVENKILVILSQELQASTASPTVHISPN